MLGRLEPRECGEAGLVLARHPGPVLRCVAGAALAVRARRQLTRPARAAPCRAVTALCRAKSQRHATSQCDDAIQRSLARRGAAHHGSSRHATPCHIMQCCVMCHVIWRSTACHVMSCHAMPCHDMSCHVVLCRVVSCRVLPWYGMAWHGMTWHGVSCHCK